jgi:ABC-type uncharacterized transport system auxiliary subunit
MVVKGGPWHQASKRESKVNSQRRAISVVLGSSALVAVLLGCGSAPTWVPGAPDATTAEHYALVQQAIDARAKADAQAALYLLRADVLRMRTNTAEMQLALSRLYRATNAVDKEDWATARNALDLLGASYGRAAAK